MGDMRKLYVFDLDDTLFRPKGVKIYLKANGERIREVSKDEFVEYELKPDESFDTSEYRSAETFLNATPITTNITLLKYLIHTLDDVIILTARESFDNSILVYEIFKFFGIENAPLICAGDYGFKEPCINKASALVTFLTSYKYDEVIIYDDCRRNLNKMNEYINNFDRAAGYVIKKVRLNWVHESGRIIPYEI